MIEGDWIEGEPQWWWKYVFPARERLWANILQSQLSRAESGPWPEPWREATAEIMEGLVMINAPAQLEDVDVGQRLREEGLGKIISAVEKARG